MSSELAMIVGLILTVVGATYISWPIFQGKLSAQAVTQPVDQTLKDLLVQREATYAAIKELEFDFQMGNLSEKDFQELQDRYKAKALTILKAIDLVKSEKDSGEQQIEITRSIKRQLPSSTTASDGKIEDQIEREIAAVRGRKPGSSLAGSDASTLDAEIEAAVKTARRPQSGQAAPPLLRCQICGAVQKDADGSYCARCGASLGNCPSCGSPCTANDAFCRKCGIKLNCEIGVTGGL